MPPYEKEYIRQDGSLIPVLIGYTLFDESGDDLVAFILDITSVSGRSRPERVWRPSSSLPRTASSARRYRALSIRGMPGRAALWLHTGRGNWSNHHSDYPARAAKRGTEILERLCRGEWVEHFETVRVSKDGQRLDLSLTVSPIRDDAGRVIGASKIARDITVRNRPRLPCEKASPVTGKRPLRRAKCRGQRQIPCLLRAGDELRGVLSLNGTVVEANRLCLDACGFGAEEVIGKPFWECGWWSGSAALMEIIRIASLQAAGGQPYRTETNYFVADGSERVLDLILIPVADEAGRSLFVAATGTDITDRRSMEDTLRQQGRRKDEFLAMLAHELRNPLAAIRTAVHILVLKGSLEPELTWGCEVIERRPNTLPDSSKIS